MFQKILIANRGEIACRVIQTARRLGVATVAVYSDADQAALHVEMADEAVHIGPSEVAKSYLRGDKIIEAAQLTGAQAIHPGYGFLSENPGFVEDVEKAGLIFIGPSANSIRAMGLKDAAKVLMEEAGVPVVPGYHGADQSPEVLQAEALKIGYPVLIKARAGGGGKGMRLVEEPSAFLESLESAAREGQNAFGDPAVLVEKYITSPRHIEVQVFGDRFGNAVHLYERDCSLQRRHQKVIEEAPAPGMSDEVRAAMTTAAVKAAKAIDYAGAGTIEFIVDGEGELRTDGFWFMEMNTRLQVEHPVTEEVTGIDLVEWQLRVASGEPLPKSQEEITLNGHAFEARLYAEDVQKGFLPATGLLESIRFGAGRIDTGVRNGDQISPFYDPMIAKITTHAQTRSLALASLRSSLEKTHVVGLTTNRAFLAALCAHDGFSSGDVDTGLIARDQDDLIRDQKMGPEVKALAALLLSSIEFGNGTTGWRHWETASHLVDFSSGDDEISARIWVNAVDGASVELGETQVELSAICIADGSVTAMVSGRRVQALSYVWNTATERRVSLLIAGKEHSFVKPDPLSARASVSGSGNVISAPMTGMVRSVLCKPGQAVSQGDTLIILEAMKMEHSLTAPSTGIVGDILCEIDDQVSDGQVLLNLDAADA